MTTLLTTNRIALLQRNLGVAIAAQVVDRGAFDLDATSEGVAAGRWSRGGDLVGFARHFCLVLKSLVIWVGLERW
jgi:hypothetical protein